MQDGAGGGGGGRGGGGVVGGSGRGCCGGIGGGARGWCKMADFEELRVSGGAGVESGGRGGGEGRRGSRSVAGCHLLVSRGPVGGAASPGPSASGRPPGRARAGEGSQAAEDAWAARGRQARGAGELPVGPAGGSHTWRGTGAAVGRGSGGPDFLV